MIVVDTNVLSEVMRPTPDPAVASWLGQNGADVAVTSITVAELLFGAARIPDSARKRALSTAIESVLTAVDVLPFGEAEAVAYASIRAAQEAAGKRVGTLDVQIAAIAKVGHHQLATRNAKHFDGIGLTVINPWSS